MNTGYRMMKQGVCRLHYSVFCYWIFSIQNPRFRGLAKIPFLGLKQEEKGVIFKGFYPQMGILNKDYRVPDFEGGECENTFTPFFVQHTIPAILYPTFLTLEPPLLLVVAVAEPL